MEGKFIGKNSMGFIHGNTYRVRSDIKMVRKGGSIFGENILCICIYDINSHNWCPYQNLEAVLKNWMFK